MTLSSNFDTLRKSELSFKSIFKILCQYGEVTAGEFIDNNDIVKWSFKDYETKVYKAASKISKLAGESNKGNYIALKMPNSHLWPVMFWGILAAGFKPILIDSTLNEEMTNFLVSQSNSIMVINNPIEFENEDMLTSPAWSDEVALCTSGTTSTSKIFTYSGEAICYQLFNLEILTENNRMNAVPGDKVLAFLPFHHVFGFIAQYLVYTFLGAAMVYIKDRAPETIMKACRSHQVTHIITVPLLPNNLVNSVVKKINDASELNQLMFKSMLSTSLSAQRVNFNNGIKLSQKLFKKLQDNLLGPQIKMIISGGSRIPYETVRFMNAIGYYVVCGYGMTEIGIASCQGDYDLNKRLNGSSGKKFKHLEYKLSEDDSELLIRGKAMHTGMLVDGKKVSPAADSEGWFKTGDIVNIDEDSLWIQGRVKDIIVNESGENVYPDELEDYFSKLPLINYISVLGTKKDNSYENITLILNMDKPKMNEDNFSKLVDAINKVNGTLPILKKVNKVFATSSELPLANGIKVKRNKLKELIENNRIDLVELNLKTKTFTATEAVKGLEPMALEYEDDLIEIKSKVRQCFAEALSLKAENIKDTDHFINDLGGDSLSSISLLTKVEDLFGIVIPDSEYYNCSSVNDLSLLILRKTKGAIMLDESAATSPISETEVKIITSFEDSREYNNFLPQQKIASGETNPYFKCHDSIIRDKSMLNGEIEVLNFGSYNYIGMSGHPETVTAAQDAAAKYGTSASGSRLLTGEKHLYKELERELAAWKHTEDCLVLVGGHSTNVTFVGNFCNERDIILYDALAHNSVAQGCQLSRSDSKAFPHNDYKALENILKNIRTKYEKILVVIEGAYSMDGDIAPVPEFVRLKKEYGFFLMVDEAHSACVIGEHGGGVDEYFNLESDDIDIKMGTLSKGLGTCGGYLAGKKSLIEYLRYNVPGFVFSVGISPPVAAATLAAVKLIQRDNSAVKRLHKNIEIFIKEAHKRKLDTCLAAETAVVPILVGNDNTAFILSHLLLEKGIAVPPAVYPAVPKDKARLRFCVTSEHKEDQIIKALDVLVDLAKENNIDIQFNK